MGIVMMKENKKIFEKPMFDLIVFTEEDSAFIETDIITSSVPEPNNESDNNPRTDEIDMSWT